MLQSPPTVCSAAVRGRDRQSEQSPDTHPSSVFRNISNFLDTFRIIKNAFGNVALDSLDYAASICSGHCSAACTQADL